MQRELVAYHQFIDTGRVSAAKLMDTMIRRFTRGCLICLICTVTIFQLVGCAGSKMPVNATPPILKIALMSDGRITVDETPATLDSLQVSLKRLAEQKGVVWYYREAGQGEPPPEASAIIKAVIENRLPIRLSSRADYSDAIGADGRPVAGGPSNK
jgi:hypothetical protein